MTEFFEAFNPGARHWREQQELDKVLVVDSERGGDGPRPLDLESGRVRLVMPRQGATPAGGSAPAPRPSAPESRATDTHAADTQGGDQSDADQDRPRDA